MTRKKFKLGLRQRVVIVTDLERGGVILKRSARKYELGTDAYLVKRDSDGASEWYPEFSLTTEASSAQSAPSEVNWYLCALNHHHSSASEAVDCDLANARIGEVG